MKRTILIGGGFGLGDTLRLERLDEPMPYYIYPQHNFFDEPVFIDPNTPTVGDRKKKPHIYKRRIVRNRIARKSRQVNRR